MRPGPKPQPAAVKKAKGNPGRRPVGEDPAPVSQASGSVVPPHWLKDDALAVWNARAPHLEKMRLLSQTDADSFGRYCRNFARWLKMQERLDTSGEFYEIETASGTVRRPDPAFLIADRLERTLSAAEDRFGLNPAERQRIYAQRSTNPSADLFGGTLAAAPTQSASVAPKAMEATAPKGVSPIGILQ